MREQAAPSNASVTEVLIYSHALAWREQFRDNMWLTIPMMLNTLVLTFACPLRTPMQLQTAGIVLSMVGWQSDGVGRKAGTSRIVHAARQQCQLAVKELGADIVGTDSVQASSQQPAKSSHQQRGEKENDHSKTKQTTLTEIKVSGDLLQWDLEHHASKVDFKGQHSSCPHSADSQGLAGRRRADPRDSKPGDGKDDK